MPEFKTAESVSPKHPDKLCDQISDAILDAYLAHDKNSRVAVETVGGHGEVFVVGEVTSKFEVDIRPIVTRLAGNLTQRQRIVRQSPEIASGVDTGGAGDQGIMVGYAVAETPELLPAEVVLARRLNQYLYQFWPSDGKTQVTLKDGRLAAVVASFQFSKTPQLLEQVTNWLEGRPKTPDVGIFINPTGEWHQGGFEADSGLTGRKLVVDNYGPQVPVGGGAFSGKDATKVDRSAAYMARRIAVDYLTKHKAKEVYCYLAYAIGVAQPVEASIIIDGRQRTVTGYDLTPKGIIDFLDLQTPQFEPTACWGHFGNGFIRDR